MGGSISTRSHALAVVVLLCAVIMTACSRQVTSPSVSSDPARKDSTRKETAMTEFVRVEIVRYEFTPEGRAETKQSITDEKTIARLVSFFPGLDEEKTSPKAATWEPSAHLVFFTAENDVIAVDVDLEGDDPELRSWSKGSGDWPLSKDFKPYFDKLSTSR